MNGRTPFDQVSRVAIRRWRLVLFACIGLGILSLVAWKKLPRLEDPLVTGTDASIVLVFPGANAEDVEKQVIDVLEPDLYAMTEVEWVSSSAYAQQALFRVHFVEGTAMDVATEKLRGKIAPRKKDLPVAVQDPLVIPWSTSAAVQMLVTVVGNRSDGELTRSARQVKRQLEALPGVSKIDLRGERARAVRVRLEPERLLAFHLTADDVSARIRAANVRAAGGKVRVGSEVTILHVDNEVVDAEGLRKVPVGAITERSGSTRTVLLGDVAEIKDDYKRDAARFMVDGQPAVALELHFRPEDNAVEVGERVRAAIKVAEKGLTAGLRLDLTFDQPAYVHRAVNSFLESLLIGMVLVMFVVTFGMGFRPGMVVAAVIPLAVGGALIGLHAFGLSLDQISIAGLIVALGLLVDDAVVVTESIQLLLDRGLSATRAAVLGTSRVFWANNGTTAVACASFLPLAFMPGDVGQIVRGLPITIIFALATSLVVAQLVTPWIAVLVLRATKGATPVSDSTPFDRNQDSAEDGHQERNAILRVMKAAYARAIPIVLRHPWKVIVLATAALVGSFALIPSVGVQFFPKNDKPILMVGVELPRGSDDDLTSVKAAEVTSVLQRDRDVVKTSAIVNGFYPLITLGRFRVGDAQGIADMLVQVDEGADVQVVARRLRDRLSAVVGVHVHVEELYKGPPVEHPIEVEFSGDDYAKLADYAEQAKRVLRAQPGTLNVTDSLETTVPITTVHVEGERAARQGMTPGSVAAALRTLHGHDKITELHSQVRDGAGSESVEVTLESGDNRLATFAQTPVRNGNGAMVPIDLFAEVKRTNGYAQLKHKDRRRVVTVSADMDGAALAAVVLQRARPALKNIVLDPRSTMTFAGEAGETEKGFQGLGLAGAAGLVIILLLLVWMFDSIKLAMVVFAAVPYALIGAVAGLFLSGNPFGFFAFLGLVALIGVFVNHKIYLIDRIRELMKRGLPWERAVHQAGIDRLRPVVLTAFTAVLGLVPLTLTGGPLFSGFGWVNIVGLLTSIPLSLILVPAFVAVAFRMHKPRATAAQADDAQHSHTLVMMRPPVARPAYAPARVIPPAPTGREDSDPPHVMDRPPAAFERDLKVVNSPRSGVMTSARPLERPLERWRPPRRS